MATRRACRAKGKNREVAWRSLPGPRVAPRLNFLDYTPWIFRFQLHAVSCDSFGPHIHPFRVGGIASPIGRRKSWAAGATSEAWVKPKKGACLNGLLFIG